MSPRVFRSWLALIAGAAVFSPSAVLRAQEAAPIDTGDAHAGQALLAAAESPESIAQRLRWWSDARFGMFIHWGLYSHDGCFWTNPQGENLDGKSEHMMRHLEIPIVEYEKIAPQFNPVKFNAAEWVGIAKRAGMKYMILTAKHHDGFAMYRSPGNGYNIVDRTPFARDPVKELAAACREQGLRFGVYYSLGRDWHDPDVTTDIKANDGKRRSNFWDFPDEAKKDFSKYFERKVKPQVRELLTQYGPIDVLWFDTPEKISPAQSRELLQLIHTLQPNCIVNSRVGNRLGDYLVREQEIPAGGEPQPWETCMTLNRHWGYHKTDHDWKPTAELVRNLVDIVSKGGNFLLNVGPTGEGVIPDPSVDRLRAVCDLLHVNGEAVYGTTSSPLPKLAWGRCTKRIAPDAPPKLFLHVFDWPADARLVVPGLRNEVTSAKLLATGQPLESSRSAEGLILNLPATAPDPISSTIVLEVVGPIRVQALAVSTP